MSSVSRILTNQILCTTVTALLRNAKQLTSFLNSTEHSRSLLLQVVVICVELLTTLALLPI